MNHKTAREIALTWITTQHQPFSSQDAERALHFHASASTVRNALRAVSLPFAYQRDKYPAHGGNGFYKLYFPRHWSSDRCAAWLWKNRRSKASVFMPEVSDAR